MIHTGSDTDIGMNSNSSDWLGMNLNPILSPGLSCDLLKIKSHQSEPIRKKFWISFDVKMVKNESDLIRFIPLKFDASIRINTNESETGLIQTEFSIWIIPASD